MMMRWNMKTIIHLLLLLLLQPPIHKNENNNKIKDQRGRGKRDEMKKNEMIKWDDKIVRERKEIEKTPKKIRLKLTNEYNIKNLIDFSS